MIQDYVWIKRGARLRKAIIGGYNVIEARTRLVMTGNWTAAAITSPPAALPW